MQLNLILLVALVGAILVAGCTNSSSGAPAVTPTPQIVYVTVTVTAVPTQTAVQTRDQLIGVWRYSDSTGIDDRIKINPDGTFGLSILRSDSSITVTSGTWVKRGDNSYDLTIGQATNRWILEPNQNLIYWNEYPNFEYSPFQGELMAASATPTFSQSKTVHFSGNGDDVQGFTVTGDGIAIFTMNYNGEHNFIVEVDDSGGNMLSLPANEIGSYSGRVSMPVSSGKYFLSVKASGPWTIDMNVQ